MGDDRLKGLAAKVYERHSEALDFIFEHRPRTGSLVDAVAQAVRGLDGLVVDTEGTSTLRFAPVRWDGGLTFKSDTGWTQSGRGFLFEVKSFPKQPGRVLLSLIMGPGDLVYREAMYAAAQGRPEIFTGLQKPMGKFYSTIFSRQLLSVAQAANMTFEAQRNNLLLAFSDFQGEKLLKLIDSVMEIDAEIATRVSAPSRAGDNVTEGG